MEPLSLNELLKGVFWVDVEKGKKVKKLRGKEFVVFSYGSKVKS